MSAEEFNRIRRILFSTIHDQRRGFTAAYDYLEGYRNKLGPASYAGLKAEIAFYQQYGQEFNLTVAGDMGEHADFAGKYGSEVSRFDVTTNINFKNFSVIVFYSSEIGNKNFVTFFFSKNCCPNSAFATA